MHQSEVAMTRVDTRSPPFHNISIKSKPKSASFGKLLCFIALTVLLTSVYYIFKRPFDYLSDPSDQYVVKNIPNVYTRLEETDPEERDVLLGFRTSFLPSDEIVLPNTDSQHTQAVYKGNITSDILVWQNSDKQHGTSARVKRMSNFTFTSKDYTPNLSDYQISGFKNQTADKYYKEYSNMDDVYTEEYDDESPMSIENESNEKSYKSNGKDDGENVKSIVSADTHVDRGPLDDVVEQVRGQPELEEGEMGSSANIYKPSRSYTGIHGFWKGQGNKDTIRSAQANIMRQYMDPEADPCYDFYQFACGNWAALNPIPADKAGYDTFEILRENLDTVLKELLEFKSHEKVTSLYPGSHLDMDDNFIDSITLLTQTKNNPYSKLILDATESYLKANSFPEVSEYQLAFEDNSNNMNILNRIRRYLNRKTKRTLQPFPELGKNYYRHIGKNTRHKNKSKSFHFKDTENLKKSAVHKRRFLIKSKEIRYGRKLQMYTHTLKKRREREIAVTKELLVPHMYEDPAQGDAALKARYLFKSCMNDEILEKRGHQPLLDLLNLMGGWPILNSQWNQHNFDWLVMMAKLRLYNNDILISEWVGPDIKNSDEFVIQFDQTSLGLPTRDYFLQDNNKVYLEAYKNYLIKVALLLDGERDHVVKCANQLIEFETKLAKITSAPEDRRNVSELYRRMPLYKLEELVPEVNWKRYLSIVMNRTVKSDETVVLFALNYVRHLVQLIEETESSTLSSYLLWRFVRHRVNNLDDRFQSVKQQFYYVLFGREQAPPRWKNCISQVNSNMGMALGSMFVRKYFDEISKNDTLFMTKEIQQSFEELLQMTDWIDDKTKKLAAHKVEAMMLRIGYPDFILNDKELNDRYKEVKVHPDKYFENILNILQHLTKMEQARLGQPVNKSLWNTAPAVVNAYYSRNKNQIMFPAGILQPPFYHRHFPRSLNYGGIGVVIGHEITHGFDDKGRLFDCDGNLHRWWSDYAIESFHHHAQCLIDQYGQYIVPEVNMKLDGVNTQGENIADNGGVKQAFRAYLHWVKQHGSSGETLPGLNQTHTQLFFLNFAQVWCGAMRPEAMRNKLKTAVHSPGRFRVIGTLSNSHDFAREFQCPPGSRMNPKDKCTVW